MVFAAKCANPPCCQNDVLTHGSAQVIPLLKTLSAPMTGVNGRCHSLADKPPSGSRALDLPAVAVLSLGRGLPEMFWEHWCVKVRGEWEVPGEWSSRCGRAGLQ